MKMISTMPLTPEQVTQVQAVRPDLTIELCKKFTEPDPNAECLLTYGWDVTEKTLDLYPNLKWIQGMSAGVDKFPLQTLKEKGIFLTNVRGVHAVQMSEQVIFGILNLLRQGRTLMHQQDQKIWNTKHQVEEMNEKTVCIVGAGRIGETVAERCRAFGMTVLGISRSGSDHPAYDRMGTLEEVENFLKISDIVVVILPLTPETQNFFNAERFSQMKDGSYFVNVARGPVVDEAALLQALETGKIRGAALDVFVTEPLPDTSPFWNMENVFLTPHIGGRSPNYTKRMLEVLHKNVKAYPDVHSMINPINLEKGY